MCTHAHTFTRARTRTYTYLIANRERDREKERWERKKQELDYGLLKKTKTKVIRQQHVGLWVLNMEYSSSTYVHGIGQICAWNRVENSHPRCIHLYRAVWEITLTIATEQYFIQLEYCQICKAWWWGFRCKYMKVQQTVTHWNIMLCLACMYWGATHCKTLQHCNIFQKHCFALHVRIKVQHTASRCNTLQHTATHRFVLHAYIKVQHTATHGSALQHIGTHGNTLQHAATHCFALHAYIKAKLKSGYCWQPPSSGKCVYFTYPYTHGLCINIYS